MTEIAEPETGQLVPANISTRQLTAIALQQGAGIDVLERLAALMERQDAIQAKKEWTAAVTAFKGECPPILKKNPVRGKKLTDGSPGPIHYHFAGYDDIKAVTIPLERKHGIVTGFSFTVTSANNLSGVLKITVGSHTEEFAFGVPIPKGINTNGTQDFGAAQTYLKRYLYLAAFDLVVAGEDSDAAGLIEKITLDQIGQVNDAIDACREAGQWNEDDSFKKMLAAYEIESLGDLPSNRVMDLLADLDRQSRKGKGVKK